MTAQYINLEDPINVSLGALAKRIRETLDLIKRSLRIKMNQHTSSADLEKKTLTSAENKALTNFKNLQAKV